MTVITLLWRVTLCQPRTFGSGRARVSLRRTVPT
jgi:hypothetical protein